ncbi:hypothetical protein [Cytobacillus kochii]|uniref:Uncharacterized protein n=1 Tax=Cytobacillus kochii TaxID=859143 RepID=A0A248TLJ3_9BACI|nr:hypothetical protein [Cytobacillus kochii]ASV69066.1 hypothetical protein CKF48_18235 [Cytobacillus kochii]
MEKTLELILEKLGKMEADINGIKTELGEAKADIAGIKNQMNVSFMEVNEKLDRIEKNQEINRKLLD